MRRLPQPAPLIAINDKNLDYEIETCLVSAVLMSRSDAINDKNLDYEIETVKDVPAGNAGVNDQ